MTKPLPPNETERLLDTPFEPEFEDLATLASRLCETPIALVSLMGEHRRWFKVHVGLAITETPREHSFWRHAPDPKEMLIVADATRDPRFADNPHVIGDPHVRFFAGAPIILEGGMVLGALCVIDLVPRELTDDQVNSLKVLARQVAVEVQMRRRLRKREKSEVRYRLLFEQNPQPMYVFDRDSLRFLAVNEAAIAHYGYSREEFLGMTIKDIRPPEDVPRFLEHVSSVPEGLDPADRWRHQLKDGSVILVEATSHTLDFDGHRAKTVLINDITERSAAEASLREQSALLDNAQRIGRMGSWRVNLLSGRLVWSSATCALFGISPVDFGGTQDHFLEFVVPEDRVSLAAAHDDADASDLGYLETEYRIRRPDGVIRWMYERGNVEYAEDGTPVARLGMVMDITESKQAVESLRLSEERFRLLFRDAAAGIAILSTDGRFIEANKAYCRMLGYSRKELKATDMQSLTHPDDRVRNMGLLDEMLEGKRRSFVVEKRYIAKDGSIVWERLSVSVIRDTGGKPVNVVGVAVDLTAQREAMEQVAQYATLLRIAGQTAKLGGWRLQLSDYKLTWSDEVCVIHEVSESHAPTLDEAIDFYSPEYRAEIRRHIEACAKDGTPFNAELELITAKDNRIWVQAIGEAVRDRRGRIVAVQGAFQDVSQRKEAEMSIAATEARIRQLAESMPIIVWTADSHGRVDYANHQLFDYTGVSRDSDPGTCWQSCLHPDDLEAGLDAWERCVRETAVFDIEYRIHGKADDSYRWFSVQARPIRDVHGNITLWYGTAIDIHETKRLEAKAIKLISRLANTLESITDGFFMIDNDWRFTYLNSEAEHILKRKRISLLHHVIWDVFPETVGSTFEREYRRAITENRTVSFEEYFPPMELWFEVRAYPSVEGLAVYFRDITQARLNAERLAEQAALLDKARDAILVRDLDHQILYWNHGAERLYGWTAGEAVGCSIEKLLYRDPLAFHAATENVLAEGEWIGELDQLTNSGETVTVEGRWTLMRDNNNEPKSILAINTDITERKKLEAQFLRAQRMESIGTLAGGIAHDLNNLLSPIVMGVDLMRQLETNPKLSPVIDNIGRSAQRGADLVKQVLSFARGVEGARVILQLEHILREVEAIIENSFPKNIRFRCKSARDLWLVVGDPTQLNQVILNLCVNARDAMPDGGQLVISTRNIEIDEQYAVMDRGASPGRYVVLEVSDEGCGMPKGVVDRVFEPFFTTKEFGKGTGLGLSTVTGIVRSHGGFVNVYSAVGHGSVFKVYLPAQTDTAEPDPDELKQDLFPRGRGECILVVDDEVSILNMTKQTLESFGYKVMVAEDGAQAIGLYAQHKGRIELVLTDMMMPVMDGPILISALRRLNPDVRIIAASGLNANGTVAKASDAGVKDFLDKPYSASRLLNLIRSVLTGPV